MTVGAHHNSRHNVKRVIITSSTAAINPTPILPAGMDESNWNQLSVDEVTQKGAEALLMHKYCASKTLAERAAWDFVEKNKGHIAFDISTSSALCELSSLSARLEG